MTNRMRAITQFPGIVFRSLRKTLGGSPAPSSAEGEDDHSATIPMSRVELDDTMAAALLATMPMPTLLIKDSSKECPKCGVGLRPLADACGSCGLTVARMATFTDERDRAVPAEIRSAWDHVLGRWQDQASHDALFQLIAARGDYGWAAGRYRAQTRERPGDAIARRQMERIRRAIEATMVVTASVRDRPEASPYKSALSLLGVLIAVLVIGMLYVVVKSRSGSPDQAPMSVAGTPAGATVLTIGSESGSR